MRGGDAPTGGGGREVTATAVGRPGGVVVGEFMGRIATAVAVGDIAGVMVGESISAGSDGVTVTVGCDGGVIGIASVDETASLVAVRDGVILKAGEAKVAQS
jgi:hypothetical protein